MYETPSAEEVAEIKAMSEAYARGELETITVGDYEARRRGRDEALAELAQSDEWKAMQTWIDDRRVDLFIAAEWDDLVELVEGKKP